MMGLAIQPSPQTAMDKLIELLSREKGIKNAASEEQQCYWKDMMGN